MNGLFQTVDFTSHAGNRLTWKVECDCLSDLEIDWFAERIAEQFSFARVVGIPRGGLRLASALEGFAKPGHPLLVVDDVWTTGNSMQEFTQTLCAPFAPFFQAAMFARKPPDDGTYAVWVFGG